VLDLEVYRYLTGRGLSPAWEERAFGVLSSDMTVNTSCARWASRGYRIVAPLHDLSGNVVNIQARNVRGNEPKTLVPKGSHLVGTVFATRTGLEVLAGSWTADRKILVAEGLTDYLALSFASPIPAISAPGAGMARRCFGEWTAGFEVILALDVDNAGERAVDVAAASAYEHGAATVRRLRWPKGLKDCCDVLARRGPRDLFRVISKHVGGDPP